MFMAGRLQALQDFEEAMEWRTYSLDGLPLAAEYALIATDVDPSQKKVP